MPCEQFFGPNVKKGTYPNIKGIAPRRVVLQKPTPQVTAILSKSWNGPYASGMVQGRKPALGGFRLVNNAGDYLARQGYSCGGSTQTNASKPGMGPLIGGVQSRCDGTKIPPSTCNTKFVYDSSDFTTFRKQQAMNRNRTDYSYGGNKSNGAYVSLMRARH
jgi:hypothetical protein